MHEPSHWRTARRASAAVESLETRVLMFGTHPELTTQALGFLNDATLTVINAQHSYQDNHNAKVPAVHFDGSFFAEGAATINGYYQAALPKANPSHFDSKNLATQFGRLLHPAQDFYAHSNWIELGKTTLIDGGLGAWDALRPYSIHSGAMLAEGEALHPVIPGYGTATFSRSGSSHVATVSFPSGVRLPAVFSGAFGGRDNTPNSIELHHNLLNKDYPTIPGYAAAAALAVKQTRQEFRRLGAMIRAWYGETGVNRLLEKWVKPDANSQAQARAVLNGTTAPPPADDNSLANARNLGTLSIGGSGRSISDFLGNADTQDFYRFTVTARAGLTIRLTGLRSDADLRLLDLAGNVLVKSANGGSSDERIGRVVGAGTYFLRVNQYSGDTNYVLSLAAATAPPAKTLTDARDLGTLSAGATTTITDSVGNAGPEDFFRFRVSSGTSFTGRLTGLSADADIVLLDSARHTLLKSSNWGTADELLTRQLAAGTYYLRVYQYSGDTNYRLTLST
jgi:hypothetical protein